RVERHRLLVEAYGAPQTRWINHGHALRGGLALQEGVVRSQVPGWLGCQVAARTVAQGYVERACHLARDVGLHLEDIRERGVERLLPLGAGCMPRGEIHQFGTHAYAADPAWHLLPPHGSRQQIAYPELAGDLRRRLPCVSVLVGAAPGDDLNTRELGELAPQLVGDPIREVPVGGVAQVLEREGGKHLGPRARVRIRVGAAPGEERAEPD